MTTKTEAKSIRTAANAFTNQQVGSMTGQIVQAFNRRDKFEKNQGLDINVDNSYTRERDRMLANKHNVARLFLSLGVKPSNVIERQVTSTSMFNAKALKKVTEIANFVCGNKQGKALPKRKLEKVTAAFIACALIASDKGQKSVQNPLNKRFLSSANLETIVKDEQLRDDLTAMRSELGSTSITGGRDTQSSQARNVLDALSLGEISSTDKHRDTITIHASNEFFSLFRSSYMVKEAEAA